MCGIVGAVAKQNIVPLLMDGLHRLEYRGYDSAGLVVLDNNKLARTRAVGKVRELEKALNGNKVMGFTGLAHTRWATHGKPTENNAHPHISGETVAVVCNGIIENHDELRQQQLQGGFRFQSETDTEVIVHQIYSYIRDGDDLLDAVRQTVEQLKGAFAIGVISKKQPNRLVASRRGSPLIVGLGDNEAYIASDKSALLSVTKKFMVLQDGDIAEINSGIVSVYNEQGDRVHREITTSNQHIDTIELGEYRHHMQKEIFEQAQAVADTLEGRISGDRLLEETFGPLSKEVFDQIKSVQILACGTSYHAGLVARNWMEEFGVPCNVEVASEFRYRSHVVPEDSLVVTVSQSGETADTLAALEEAKRIGFRHSLVICNVPESSLIRESDLILMTHAGPEIGVASTKAFTTQLTALLLLSVALGRRHGLTTKKETAIVKELRSLPAKIEQVLKLDSVIADIAKNFADKQNALFLGRGAHYSIALEGALKLKEISYIHAEAYPAGELKHGPLALVDASMPIIAVAPNNQLLEKLKSNIQEVRARGGKLIVFADVDTGLVDEDGLQVLNVAPVDDQISPIIFTIPLQLLAYHVAVIKGTDVDKPRNLAKSVTVE